MKSRARLVSAVLSLTALFASSSWAPASTKTYFGPDGGVWSASGNWNPSGQPVPGDTVFLGSHGPTLTTVDLNVTFDGNYNTPLNTLTLNSTGINGYMNLNQTGANTLMNSIYENIGVSVNDNRYNQNAGTNSVGLLSMGVNAGCSNNFYNLSGSGVLSFDSGDVVAGVSGTATFNQSGGTNSGFGAAFSVSTFTLGKNTSGSGTYNLSGGSFSTNELTIGYDGTGVFNQTGGTASAFVELGFHGGTGTYNLSGGTLSGPVHLYQNATFNLQFGGTLNGAGISFDGGGVVNLQGGGASSPPGFTFATSGGTLNLLGHNFTGAYLDGDSGVVQNGASGNVVLTLQTGSDVHYTGTIQDGASGRLGLNYSGSAVQTLNGTNTYTGATVVTSGTLRAGTSAGFSPASAFIVNGGKLDAGGLAVTLASLSGTGGTVDVGTGSITTGNSTFTSYGGQLAGSGIFHKTGSNGLAFSGGGAFTGTLDVQAGTLTVGGVNGLPTGSTVSLGLGTTFNVNFSQTLAALSAGVLTTTAFSGNPTLTLGGTNLDMTHGAAFTGTGTLVKAGSGNLTLGFGAADTFANGDGSLSVVVNAGLLTLNKAAGTTAVAGPLTLNGGSAVLAASNQIADATTVAMAGGTFNLAGNTESIGGLTGTTGNILLGGGSLTVAASTAGTYDGGLTGPGNFIKSGPADFTITNAGTYGGAFTANQGRLILQGPVNATGLTANSGGTLRFNANTLNLNNGTIQANTGGTVEYLGATINSGFLRGAGTHTILAGNPSTFNGVTTYNSTVINQNGATSFNNFTNGGTINNNAALTFNGAVNAGSGIINVNGTLNTQDFTSAGVLNINNGGVLNNAGSNLFSVGGSRTTINAGGTLTTVPGTTYELNGALLTNNGTQNGVLDVNYGSTARGNGVFGTVSVGVGGKFGNNGVSSGTSVNVSTSLRLAPSLGSATLPLVGPQLSTTPGIITVGGMILGPGSTLGINVQNAQGNAGVGCDTVHDRGALTLTGSNLPGELITISLASLSAAGTPGAAQNFDPSQFYGFTLVTANGGITGFTPDEFAVDSGGFANALNGGVFTVAENGNTLRLDFNPAVVPEPATWVGVVMFGVLAGTGWRRHVRGGSAKADHERAANQPSPTSASATDGLIVI